VKNSLSIRSGVGCLSVLCNHANHARSIRRDRTYRDRRLHGVAVKRNAAPQEVRVDCSQRGRSTPSQTADTEQED